MDLNDALDRFRGPLTGLIVSWGAGHVDARELAQDSFADAYLNREACLGDWQDAEVFGRWLRGVARNRYRNWARSKSRRERSVSLVEPIKLQSRATDSEAISDPRIARLRESIERLPAKQRQVVLMHYLDESSVGDVAALLSLTSKAVEGRLYQARKALKRMIQESGDEGIGKASIVKALLL